MSRERGFWNVPSQPMSPPISPRLGLVVGARPSPSSEDDLPPRLSDPPPPTLPPSPFEDEPPPPSFDPPPPSFADRPLSLIKEEAEDGRSHSLDSQYEREQFFEEMTVSETEVGEADDAELMLANSEIEALSFPSLTFSDGGDEAPFDDDSDVVAYGGNREEEEGSEDTDDLQLRSDANLVTPLFQRASQSQAPLRSSLPAPPPRPASPAPKDPYRLMPDVGFPYEEGDDDDELVPFEEVEELVAGDNLEDGVAFHVTQFAMDDDEEMRSPVAPSSSNVSLLSPAAFFDKRGSMDPDDLIGGDGWATYSTEIDGQEKGVMSEEDDGWGIPLPQFNAQYSVGESTRDTLEEMES